MFLMIFLGQGSVNLFSQLPLNLDFERLSVEGLDRPWGWTVYAYAANIRSVCDSLEVHSGTYSLKIENPGKNEDSLYELAFFIEPSQVLNKKLRLEGWVKAETLEGKAGLRLFTVGPEGDGFAELEEDKITLTQANEDWTKGYVAEDYGFGGRYVIPEQFDGVFFVEETTASQTIKKE